jgi:hypothetical protein
MMSEIKVRWIGTDLQVLLYAVVRSQVLSIRLNSLVSRSCGDEHDDANPNISSPTSMESPQIYLSVRRCAFDELDVFGFKQAYARNWGICILLTIPDHNGVSKRKLVRGL